MIENEHAGLLGTGTAARFVMVNLGYKKSEAYAIVRVARELKRLPKCIEAFGTSSLSLCQLKEIVRIAKAETEEKWLSFAARHTADRLALEVRPAADRAAIFLPAPLLLLSLLLSRLPVDLQEPLRRLLRGAHRGPSSRTV